MAIFRTRIIYYSYLAYSYSQYINRQKNLTKHNLCEVLNSYMFRHLGAFLTEGFFFNKVTQGQEGDLGIASLLLKYLKYIQILKHIKLISIKLQYCDTKIMW